MEGVSLFLQKTCTCTRVILPEAPEFTLAAGLMVMVALIAALLPAYRALKTDPIIALRAE